MIWILCCASGLPRMHLFRMLDEVRRLSGCSYTTTHPSDLLHGLAIWLATKKKSGWKQNKGKERLEFTFKPMSISRQQEPCIKSRRQSFCGVSPGALWTTRSWMHPFQFFWGGVGHWRCQWGCPVLQPGVGWILFQNPIELTVVNGPSFKDKLWHKAYAVTSTGAPLGNIRLSQNEFYTL